MLLILAGCSDASPYAEEPSAQERTITLNLDITTKTSAPTTESPDNFHLWIFNGDKLLKYISSNPIWEEIYNGGIDLKATIKTKIDATEVNSIQFYLLLNTNVTDPLGMTPANLKNLTFTLPDQPYSHDNKVPMSGEATLDIFPSQIHYDVRIDAVRSVAKLGIYCTKGNTSPSSTLTINQVTLSKVPDKGYLFEPDPDSYTSIKYTGTKNLLSITEQITVTKYYTGKMPSYSEDSWAETTTEESFEEYLNDELFVDDSVTGNASGSYTFSVNEAAENLVGNFDLLDEVFSEFGQPNFNSRSWSDFPEFADVSIRCYLLGGAISDCLDELGEDIYVDVEEDEDY